MVGCEGESLAHDLGLHTSAHKVQRYFTPLDLGTVQCHREAALLHHWSDLVHAFPTTTTTLDCQFSFWKLFHFGRISSSAISTDQRLSRRHPPSLTCRGRLSSLLQTTVAASPAHEPVQPVLASPNKVY